MNVSIIIPNYNGQHLLRKNLSTVLEAAVEYTRIKLVSVEVIIIDDCSTDGSVDYIKDKIKSIKDTANYSKIDFKLLKNTKNLGFSSAVNRGARETRGEIVILLNTDVTPEKDFLAPLIARFNNPQIFAVGCLDKSVEGKKIVLRGRGIGKFQRGFLVHGRGEVDKTDTLWVSGGSGAFRKSIWEQLGGLDSLFDPFYWEDIDLSYRALKTGYRIIFEPKSVVTHQHEYGAIRQNNPNFKIKIIAYRNQFIFVWKNITDYNKKLWHIAWLPYHFVKAFLRGDIYFLIGFVWALTRLPDAIRKRATVKKLFTKTDKEILG